ncbi:MAG: M23 family metallopeptidase [Balneolaceae bacterium]|nr:M23 family metallopeptidase [Balneolaceae bacterium]MCH8547782.1 M23 family metallopeptidase [Balneolaceae bacterium]
MADNNHFYYDEEKCEFIPVSYEKKKKVVHTLSFWLINGIVLASMGIALLSHYVGTPAEIALKAENRALLNQLETTRSSIINLESQLGEISELDNEMYRSVLGLEPIPEEERMAGTGGSDPYSHFDLYSEETSEILRWTASRLDNLERRLGIQKMSFDEVKAFYNENKEWLRNMPAIRPTNGIILSGYGMRTHPVLGYKRMHHGIDLRADIGTEIFATGDGVVKFAGRRGTYGNLLEIDHGNGYVTRYAHLSAFEDGIRPGVQVKRGDLVALSGDTGVTQGPHLHYEVRLNGESLDPLNYLFADITPDEYQLYREIAESNPMSMD